MRTTSYDYRQDWVSPLMGRRLCSLMFSRPLQDRLHGRFHREIITLLGPDLLEVPYCSRGAHYGGRGQRIKDREWLKHRRAHDLRIAEEQRNSEGVNPIEYVRRQLRPRIEARPGHEAWEFLDRARVSELMTMDIDRLDYASCLQMWSLATIFC
jgi:hypothetical protein